VYAWRHTRLFLTRNWKITGLFCAAHVLLVCLFGGAVLERYLLPVLPILYIAFAVSFASLPGRWRFSAFALFPLLIAANFINPVYPFPFENNLAFASFVTLNQRAADFIEVNFPGATVSTTFPMAGALRRPDFGYVSHPVKVREIDDFRLATIARLRTNPPDAVVLYSVAWDPLHILENPTVSRLLTRYYDYEPQASSREIQDALHMRSIARWTEAGQWIEEPSLWPIGFGKSADNFSKERVTVISLKKTIEAYDYREMFEAALDSYRSAVDHLEKHIIALDREGVKQYRAKLHNLRERLAPGELRPEMLRSHAEELGTELYRYRSEIESILSGTGNDLRDVVAVLAEATETLSQRENMHGGQLSRISGGLEAISQLGDIHQIRMKLSQHVLELRTCIEQMSQENETALQTLQHELKGFQKRLEKVQVEASTDPLTGVSNRRRASREIATRIRERQNFGILLFDLNRFKQINDTHGHGAGDSVLQIVAQRLQGQIRKQDLLSRWGGDEFVVVHEGRTQELQERAREIASRVAGTIAIRVEEAEVEVTIGTEVGWAEYREGETPEQLFARADRALYETKQKRPARTPVLTIGAGMTGAGTTSAAVAEMEPAASVQERPPDPVKMESPFDPATSLPRFSSAETAMKGIRENAARYYIGCFAFRRAGLINAHYRYLATDELLPFLRDRILASKFNGRLFRGPGASVVALVECANGIAPLELEVRGIAGTGWEENLQQKRRASKLPVAVRGLVLPLKDGVPEVLHQISIFLHANQSIANVG
jgi:diguanylate cyclase (GGDEF)-like protein